MRFPFDANLNEWVTILHEVPSLCLFRFDLAASVQRIAVRLQVFIHLIE
jgi:hypothetical protein